MISDFIYNLIINIDIFKFFYERFRREVVINDELMFIDRN